MRQWEEAVQRSLASKRERYRRRHEDSVRWLHGGTGTGNAPSCCCCWSGRESELTSVRHFPHQMDGRAYSRPNGTDGGGVKTV